MVREIIVSFFTALVCGGSQILFNDFLVISYLQKFIDFFYFIFKLASAQESDYVQKPELHIFRLIRLRKVCHLRMIKNMSLIQAVLTRRQNMSEGRPTDPEQLVGGGGVLVVCRLLLKYTTGPLNFLYSFNSLSLSYISLNSGKSFLV
jgi:hypothetical protein